MNATQQDPKKLSWGLMKNAGPEYYVPPKRSEFTYTRQKFRLLREEVEDARFFDLVAEKVQLDREIHDLREEGNQIVRNQIASFAVERGFTPLELQTHHALAKLLEAVLRSRLFKLQLMATPGLQRKKS